MKSTHEKLENPDKEQVPKAPVWFSVLLYGVFILAVVGVGFYFSIIISAIILLIFSASFVGYLAEAYTTDLRIGSFAKSVAMAMGIIGIVMLFISVSWWGFAGIFGYWILIALSMAFWRKNITFRPFK
jgi:hypothetical protein